MDEAPDRARVHPWIWALSALGLAGAAFVGVWTAVFPARALGKVRVQNATGASLSGVTVVVAYGGPTPSTYSLAALAPGEELAFTPPSNDLAVTILYLENGAQVTLPAYRIDLWTGESYRMLLQPGGKLEGNYDYPPR